MILKPLPQISANPDHTYILVGASMTPTLRPPDVLTIVPYNGQAIARGDIIVFKPSGCFRNITHRVVRVEGEKVYTRGDNNGQPDGWELSLEQIKGKVVTARRGNRQLVVYGGGSGQLVECSFRFLRRLKSLVRPLYLALAKRVCLPLKTSTLVFKKQFGTDYQLLLGRWAVGRWNHRSRRWNIRVPFRFFVNEAGLPRFS